MEKPDLSHIIWIFVSKVMSLIFNMLSRFIIVFLPRSKCLLISWLQSLSTVILEPEKMKFAPVWVLLECQFCPWRRESELGCLFRKVSVELGSRWFERKQEKEGL